MERARILLQYHTGKNLSAIHRALNISRVTIYHCVHKALDMGVEGGSEGCLSSIEGSGHWQCRQIVGGAFGVHQAQGAWTCGRAMDAQGAVGSCAQHAQAAGHPSLVQAAKATVQRILDEPQLQPLKVRYYLERRDPEYHS